MNKKMIFGLIVAASMAASCNQVTEKAKGEA